MLFCQYCGASLPNTSAVCGCRAKPKINDGGPITPTVAHSVFSQDESGRGLPTFHYTPGMSLRDYFAGQALVGLMSDPGLRPDKMAEFQHMAVRLYQVADAMLRERGK